MTTKYKDMAAYKGQEPCQGCGEVVLRDSKSTVCDKCRELIDLGKTVQLEREYEVVFQHLHAYSMNATNRLLHLVLEAVTVPGNVKGEYNCVKHQDGSNGIAYRIPKGIVERLRPVFQEVDETLKGLRDKMKAAPSLIEKAIQEERDRIFKEGVEHGKNLLLRLNDGEITMDDFAKRV